MKIAKNSIYIVCAKRTAIGSPARGLKDFNVASMTAPVIKALVEETRLAGEEIQEVILGNTVSTGTGQNFARQAAVLSGLPLSTPAFVINNVCGSGLQALIVAMQSILAQDKQCIIAGAAESATHSPVFILDEQPHESLKEDGLHCPLAQQSMGEICETLVSEAEITRILQDEYALKSHQKACQAKSGGKFVKEIVPLTREGKSSFVEDERPRSNTNLEKLARLSAAFKRTGTITGGNASVPSDGAAAFLVCGKEFIEKKKLVPVAQVLCAVSLAVEPKEVFSQGIRAIKMCLKEAGLSVEDVDLFEVVEAFAAQAVYTQQALNIPQDKMNIWGGDLALGHPLATAGARALVTLIHALKNEKKKRGIVYAAFGAGGAIAMIVEAV